MLLEVGNLGAVFLIIFLIMHLPSIILGIIGLAIRKDKPKKAKTLFIIAGVYLLVSYGTCGAMIGF
jgi:low temperature requirement protein LtrA